MGFTITNSEKLKGESPRDLRINSNVVLLERFKGDMVCIGLVIDGNNVLLIQDENVINVNFSSSEFRLGGASVHKTWKIVGECDIQIDVLKVFNRL